MGASESGSRPGIAGFTPPRLGNALFRGRLIERLRLEEEKKLILILGQAAQEKSTLAAWFVRESKTPFTWINLSSNESSPINLLYCLIKSIEISLPDADLSALVRYASISLGPRAEGYLFKDWAWNVFRPAHSPLRIVLDGLDRLPPDALLSGFSRRSWRKRPSIFVS